jgi:hypothetical protein
VFSDFNKLANPKIHSAINDFGDGIWLNMSAEPMIEFSKNVGCNEMNLVVVRKFLEKASL